MIKIITVIIAVLLIGFIAWWFFGKREQKEVDATMNDNMQKVTVTVDGGYSPNTVVLKKDVPAEVIFDRKDPSNCLEKVVFEDFGINQFLPEKQKTAIKIDTSKTGEYNYACGMNMFHGKVIVK